MNETMADGFEPPSNITGAEMTSVTFADGRSVPPIGMGSWHLGQGRYPASQEEQALQLGLDLGMRLIDTAEMYGDGASERLIGRAIKGRRDDAFLVSKAYPWHANRLMIDKACNGSLARLGVEQIDLYLLHWHAGSVLSEVIHVFERLVREGKIRSWGVSNLDVDDLQALLKKEGGAACATNQVLYNVGSRGIEYSLQPWCDQHDMPIMAYSPLGSGDGLLRSSALYQVAVKHSVSTAAIALAWSIRSGKVIAIPESGEPSHIRENAAVLGLQLDAEDLAAIDTAYPPPGRKVSLDSR